LYTPLDKPAGEAVRLSVAGPVPDLSETVSHFCDAGNRVTVHLGVELVNFKSSAALSVMEIAGDETVNSAADAAGAARVTVAEAEMELPVSVTPAIE
jgi:hypothetical protein